MPSGDSVARIALSPFLGRQVSKALSEGDYDVVHIHEPLTPMLPLQFLRQSRALTIGTFHAAHDNGSKGYLLAGPVLRRMAPKLHGRIAVSPAAARGALPLLSRQLRDYPERYRDRPLPRRTRPARPTRGEGSQHPVRRSLRGAQGSSRSSSGRSPN